MRACGCIVVALAKSGSKLKTLQKDATRACPVSVSLCVSVTLQNDTTRAVVSFASRPRIVRARQKAEVN